MATYYIEMGEISGEYVADDENGARDAFAQDAGYSSWQDAADQGLAGGELVIEINTEALVAAAPAAVFQDSYGSGVALMGGRSFSTWHELAQSFGRNVWDFQGAALPASVWMVEQNTGHQWEPVPDGAFKTAAAADDGLASLVDVANYDARTLRVVEYTGDRAAAYLA